MKLGTTKYAELCFSTVVNDIDTLERNVRDYPASSLARFLLLYHYKKNRLPGFEKLAGQTGVYLNNPYWIQYQLSQADTFDEREIVKKEIENISTITNQPIVNDEDKSPSTESEENKSEINNEEEDASIIANQPIVTEDDASNENNDAHDEEVVSIITNQPIVTEEVENDFAIIENKENLSKPINDEEASAISNQPVVNDEEDLGGTANEEHASNENNDAHDEEVVSIINNQPIVTEEVENDCSIIEKKENISKPINDEEAFAISNQPVVNDEEDLGDTANEEHASNENNDAHDEEVVSIITNQPIENDEFEVDVSTIANQPIINEEVENDYPIIENEENISETNNAEEISNITNQPILTDKVEIDYPAIEKKAQACGVNKEESENEFANKGDQDQCVKENDATITIQPTNDTFENDSTEQESIAFEPLHTVDYFASQGIKISREELEKDALGKQVKSFTAWLKSMKKLHPGQVPEQNEVIEKIIQTSSEISNQNANVLTEAMAEVLVKQDKKGKAIEMYQKLSLINPSKSAYFAAKIENLKHI